jgi:RNA polymerase sigma factor (sigma-70 family)
VVDGAGQVPIEELLSHAGWVRGLAFALVRDVSTADDLTQDAYVAALRSPPAATGNPRGWLKQVVLNVWRQRYRSNKARARREAAATRDEVLESPDLLERAEMQRRVVGYVTTLEEPYRTVILMRYFDELPPREIAKRLGETPETIYSRLKTAHEKLKRTMGEEHGE